MAETRGIIKMKKVWYEVHNNYGFWGRAKKKFRTQEAAIKKAGYYDFVVKCWVLEVIQCSEVDKRSKK